MLSLDAPQDVGREIDLAVRAERRDRLTCGCIERDQPPAARDENPALLAVTPRGDPAMDEARAIRWLTRIVGVRVVGPELTSGRGVERRDAVERGAQK